MSDNIFIQFTEPSTPENIWRGSLTLNAVDGHTIRAVCSPLDKNTDLKSPIPFAMTESLSAALDMGRTAILYKLQRIESTTRFASGQMALDAVFKAEKVIIGSGMLEKGLDTSADNFSISSPIVFSFLNKKPYWVKAAKRSKRFSMGDEAYKTLRYESRIFKSIEVFLEKSMRDSIDGNEAKIRYNASLVLHARQKLDLRQIAAVSEYFEKILFFMVGCHCGPPTIRVGGKKRGRELCQIHPSSVFYSDKKVVPGLERIWTLSKIDLNLGAFLDRVAVCAKTIEKPLELILDAQLSSVVQERFFKRVRSLEAIGRDLLPKGNEKAPEEIGKIAEMLESHNADLLHFFNRRCRPIFEKKNGLGYAIDFMKEVFPFNPVLEIDKKTLVRLRNLEAHAASHSFSAEEDATITFYGEALDFITRALILKYLGLSHEQIFSGLPFSRFGWIIGKKAN